MKRATYIYYAIAVVLISTLVNACIPASRSTSSGASRSWGSSSGGWGGSGSSWGGGGGSWGGGGGGSWGGGGGHK